MVPIMIRMPDLKPLAPAESTSVGRVAVWLKKQGDVIAAGDVLCEIENGKRLCKSGANVMIVCASQRHFFVVVFINFFLLPTSCDTARLTLSSNADALTIGYQAQKGEQGVLHKILIAEGPAPAGSVRIASGIGWCAYARIIILLI